MDRYLNPWTIFAGIDSTQRKPNRLSKQVIDPSIRKEKRRPLRRIIGTPHAQRETWIHGTHTATHAHHLKQTHTQLLKRKDPERAHANVATQQHAHSLYRWQQRPAMVITYTGNRIRKAIITISFQTTWHKERCSRRTSSQTQSSLSCSPYQTTTNKKSKIYLPFRTGITSKKY